MNPYLISYLPILILSLGFFHYSFSDLYSKPKWLFIAISMIYFVTCGVGSWLNFNLGQDNYQWFFIGKNLFQDFKTWWHYFGTYDHTRILSALPVGFLWWIGISNPNTIYNLLVIFCFLGIIVFLYPILKAYTSERNTQVALALFTICISTFGSIDFWTFSSEHIVILLFSFSLYLLHKSILSENKQALLLILSGVFLTATPFAKEQFSMSAIIVYLTISIYFTSIRQFRKWIAFTIGCLTSALCVWFLCLYHSSLQSLTTYYTIGFEYQNRTFADQTPIAMNWFFVLRFLKLTLINPHFIIFTISTVTVSILAFRPTFKSLFDPEKKIITLVFISYFIMALISILLAKKEISHYTTLLIPGFIFVFTLFLQASSKKQKTFAYSILIYFLIAPIALRSMQSIYPVLGYRPPQDKFLKDKTQQIIRTKIPLNQKVLLWGYANQHMVGIEAIRSSCYLFSQFAFPPMSTSALVRSQYLKDVKLFSPTYVLELVGPSQFFTTDKEKHSIAAAHPELQNHLDRFYEVVLDSADVKIYKQNTID